MIDVDHAHGLNTDLKWEEENSKRKEIKCMENEKSDTLTKIATTQFDEVERNSYTATARKSKS